MADIGETTVKTNRILEWEITVDGKTKNKRNAVLFGIPFFVCLLVKTGRY